MALAAPAASTINLARTSYIYFWRSPWDGSIQPASPAVRFIIPISIRGEANPPRNMRRRNPKLGVTKLWYRLKKRSYSRTVESLHRVIRWEGLFLDKSVKKSPKSKPYEPMTHPGERVQIDAEVVPRRGIADPQLRLF